MSKLFNLDDSFNFIINKLQQGHRVHLELDSEQVEQFQKEFFLYVQDLKTSKLESASIEKISQSLCVLDHLSSYHCDWQQILLAIMNSQQPKLIVLALGTSHKHIIGHHHRLGQRVPFLFIQKLEQLLETNDPEIFEWTLRTIEALGGQSLYFKQKLMQKRPGLLKRFQAKWKNSFELIEFMQKNWQIKD